MRQQITPNLTLHVRALSGARTLLSGRVAIDSAGDPPPQVELEVYDASNPSKDRWQLFGPSLTVNKHDRFRYLYHLSPALAGYRFAFRAVTPQTQNWQGAASTSTKATVKL